MLDRLFGFKIQDYLQTFGLFIIAVGLPLSKVLMSIGAIWLVSNVLLKMEFKTYWERWRKEPTFWFILTFFLLHILGLFYTSDFSYGFKDIKAKLPLFVVPTALIAYPIQKRFFNYILYGFLISLIITSLINFSFIISGEITDYREFSRFGSHIRYALLIVMGILISFSLWIEDKRKWWLFLVLFCWFSYYTFASQVVNGYLVYGVILFVIILILTWRIPSKSIRITAFTLCLSLIILFISLFLVSLRPNKESWNFEHLDQFSAHNERYFHDTTSLWIENGNPVLVFIAEDEIDSTWNKYSNMNLEQEMPNGLTLKTNLILYLTSKGIRKDKEGIESLSKDEIKLIENGTTSVLESYPSLYREFRELQNTFLQYSLGNDPDGNTVSQRFVHWNVAKEIIKKNWIVGVGTGDVQNAFNRVYEETKTNLDNDHWYRAHNQFLTFWISFGILGFIAFILFWIWFLYKNIRNKYIIGIGFTLIAIISFLSEDTLETQQGVSFIAMFIGLTLMKITDNELCEQSKESD
ncbi:MAG: O-antigen ligase family protein [Brumimicrobium sp.]|nr:O-antigen ligase family protein [Brumimicrobium sp.]MCO5269782.1 O-antigen ligase family protein [Brumimicrobium sp.]